MSKYTKTSPNISYSDFLKKVKTIQTFKSLTGREYRVECVEEDIMILERMSTNKIWRMDLKAVYDAYKDKDINISGVKDFMPYLKRTKSPALGLLLTLELLK